MKDELGGKIMIDFVVLRANMYAYRKPDHLATQHEHKELEDKRCKGTKKCVVAEILIFDCYKTCLFKGKKFTENTYNSLFKILFIVIFRVYHCLLLYYFFWQLNLRATSC